MVTCLMILPILVIVIKYLKLWVKKLYNLSYLIIDCFRPEKFPTHFSLSEF